MADLPELGPIRSYIPVPEVFHSFMDKKPFSKCLVCTKLFLDDGTEFRASPDMPPVVFL
ncbi:hypothetical protein [Bythopirellula goksoeyrii]|uniref:hypothetical protein n=1 Tax=Bythopirellula goksoeyrii TaxID=1400387 RepID=UPI00143D7A51|nr:hypothetical protein [Bythopirellula goksoeyrii]